jgi:diguanylate cyclase (GGDEF)-like protein
LASTGALLDTSEVKAAIRVSRMVTVIRYVAWVGISAHAAFVGLFAFLGFPVLAVFNVASVVTWSAAWVLNNRGRSRLAAGLIIIEVILHAVLAVSTLGWNSGFHYYLIPLIAFILFNDQLQSRLAIFGATGVTLVYVVLRLLTMNLAPPPSWTGWVVWLEAGNILIPLVALALITLNYRYASIDAEQRMAELAMTDALTRLPNRRRMRAMLADERARAVRSGRPFGVVIADLDHFKKINDTHGHEAGDRVLRAVASVLKQKLRQQDCVARWGGEEFLFLLPDTDLNGAGALAEKLRDAVASAPVDIAATGPLPVTMTFGVTAFLSSQSIDQSLRLADEALYRGKTQGRNRVVLSQTN